MPENYNDVAVAYWRKSLGTMREAERQQVQALLIQNTSKPSVPAPEEEAERQRRQQRV